MFCMIIKWKSLFLNFNFKLSFIFPAGKCDVVCPKIYAPVCDSAGTTHGNMCILNGTICKALEEGNTLKFASKGEAMTFKNFTVPIRSCSSFLKFVTTKSNIVHQRQTSSWLVSEYKLC